MWSYKTELFSSHCWVLLQHQPYLPFCCSPVLIWVGCCTSNVHFPLLLAEKPSTKRDKISPAPPRKSGQTSKQKWPLIFLYHPITSLFSTSPSLPSGCCFPFLQCICSREAGTVGEVPRSLPCKPWWRAQLWTETGAKVCLCQ